jgi:hypothetical protein
VDPELSAGVVPLEAGTINPGIGSKPGAGISVRRHFRVEPQQSSPASVGVRSRNSSSGVIPSAQHISGAPSAQDDASRTTLGHAPCVVDTFGCESSFEGGTMASATPVTDHEEIREWVESRGGRPACVKGTAALLRVDFGEPDDKLQPIEWDQWFETFDSRNLAALIQEGGASRFIKLVSRESAGTRGGGGGARGRSKGSRAPIMGAGEGGGKKAGGKRGGARTASAGEGAGRGRKARTLVAKRAGAKSAAKGAGRKGGASARTAAKASGSASGAGRKGAGGTKAAGARKGARKGSAAGGARKTGTRAGAKRGGSSSASRGSARTGSGRKATGGRGGGR